jgi:hypothetical protein
MSADLHGSTGDAPAPADQPRAADSQSVLQVADRSSGESARQQKYAHLTEGSAETPRPYPPLQARSQDTGKLVGTDEPQSVDGISGADRPQGTEHANGADRAGTHPYPEVPSQRPSDSARSVEPDRQPDETGVTHLHLQDQAARTDGAPTAGEASRTLDTERDLAQSREAPRSARPDAGGTEGAADADQSADTDGSSTAANGSDDPQRPKGPHESQEQREAPSEVPAWMESYLTEREAKSKAEFDARMESLQAKVDTAEAKAQAAEAKADAAQDALTRAGATHKAETDALRREVQDERDERRSQQATDQVLKDKLSEELQQNRAQAEAAEVRVKALEHELAKKADRPPPPDGAEVAQWDPGGRDIHAEENNARVSKSEQKHKNWKSDANLGFYATALPAVPAVLEVAAQSNASNMANAAAAVFASAIAAVVVRRAYRKDKDGS